ncbi:2-oxoglutarate and iron-dependent oxygenase domain-containing protein [Brevundimonas sp.]|uniref:isopenicillin N synthase family dioxygenase n=1 Tax=Brevundimonas sp. TaxID=1871086 RepID=UPI0025D65717|nr:2-oxoglutarate and iron-dependent oxygenase domain-containing protein [Brevundimonas sp.]
MTTVPELDLADWTSGDPARRDAFAKAQMAALQRWGFFVLKGHAVSQDLLDRAYALAEDVFALPEEAKRRYAGSLRGYTPFGVEHAKDSGRPDLKEFWQVGHDPVADEVHEAFPPNVWPDEIAGFRETFTALFEGLNATGLTLLEALEPELGLEPGWFEPRVRRGTSLLRVLHYPPVADDQQSAGCVRSAAHEDINFITVMVGARGAGLELLDRDGRWLPVEAAPGTLIVDSGDMLQRLTNGVIPATTHRVVNPEGPNVSRYSMPFFMHPTLETSLEPLPSCLGDGPKWPATTAGEYLDERLRQIGLKA